jgi:DNA-directed RNA polymerase III subunit RPC11
MRTHLKRKEVDDVLGGKDSWANVDSVDGESSRVELRGM